jgi:hypothetical protein
MRFGCRLVVMVKSPVVGRVKTRLARTIGGVTATQFYRHTCAAVLARLSATRRWQTLVAVTPDRDLCGRAWPAPLARLPQGGGDLGARLDRVMRSAPPGPTLIIGTDIPAIRKADISAAFAKLGRHDAVFGPAPDGGYWLVGLRRRPRLPRPFSPVRWSSPWALADTEHNLGALSIGRAATLDDVDDAASYAHARSWHGRRVLPASVGMTGADRA